MRTLVTIILVAATTTGNLLAQDHDRQAAPFNAIRWAGEPPTTPEVRLGADWYEWTGIDEVRVEDIAAFCKQQWPSKWRKRVGEDLVEALVLMKKPVGAEVNLSLIDLETRKPVTRDKVAMTEGNRLAVLAYNQGDSSVPTSTKGPAIGEIAPELECKDLDGNTVTLASLRGKTVLVDFWATWCSPCIKEFPHLAEAYDAWTKEGLVILGVSTDEPHAGDAVRKLVGRMELPWTILHDAKAGNAGVSAAWGVKTIPQCFLIDASGRVQAMGLRGKQVEAAVGQLIRTGRFDEYSLPARGEMNRKDDLPKLSPFTGVRFPEGGYEVRLDDSWYRLVSLAGVGADDIHEFCATQYGANAQKRFAEDLVEVLVGLGLPVTTSVNLVLEDLETGERTERSDAPMTGENRQSAWEYNNSRGPSGPSTKNTKVERIERVHAGSATSEFQHLASALEWSGWSDGQKLDREQVERDLDQLEWLVEHTFSYRDLNGVDYRAAFDAVRAGVEDDVHIGAFTTRVAQLLALFGDGHTRVRGLERDQPRGYLPFLVADAEGGVIAFRDDRSALLDPEFPFVVSLDGRPTDEWLTVAQRTVAAGSEQFARYYGLRNLRMLNANRLELGAELASHVDVVLANDAGSTRELSMPVARSKPVYGPWPRTNDHRLIDGDLGYLRVDRMDGDGAFLEGLVEAMRTFRDTRGLIIDVRGNGGGTRDALRTLLPYFLTPDSGPRVVNVGAYRLHPGDDRSNPGGFLGNRYMFPATSSQWSDAERQAIGAFAREFTPDWVPDTKLFSDWHYFVLSPGGEYHYDRPVVVLMDTGCFSATDIFLGAFAEVPSVTLLGAPSGGGSGRSQGSTLVESSVSLRMSSMASFRPNGKRYDGLGVEPDVTVEPNPQDFLEGGGDSVLDAAVARLR